MGTPIIPIDVLPGVMCDRCWGTGGSIGLITPGNCSVAFNGWGEGNLWNEMYRAQLSTPQELIQNVGTPCLFSGVSADLNWWVSFHAGGTYGAVFPIAPLIGICFIGDHATQCEVNILNDVGDIPNAVVFGGNLQMSFGGGFP